MGYDVVMKLIATLVDQGYQLFTDNFYTSPIFLKHLFLRNTTATGTITEKRKGFPDTVKGGKAWAKTKERGAMRWERDDECLALQWIYGHIEGRHFAIFRRRIKFQRFVV